ncbi:MAG: glycosyltransferase family 4 protein [Ruminococcaceae bacterium]|nr:glycosyltransferase family 4 protein [Oscillospiraceae bacterium]
MGKLFRFVKKVYHYISTKGIDGACNYIDKIADKVDVFAFYHYIVDQTKIELDRAAYEEHKNDEVKLLNWIIPEMGPGSGGHINIFRFISNLENMGFHSRIYIHNPQSHLEDDATLKAFLREHFSILDERVECYGNCNRATFAHATIATSWQTAYFVRNFENTISRFYFVQDFEPYFYAMGSEYEFANNTYKFGLRGITAGDWLKDKLRDEYGMQTESFGFSYDKDIYKPYEKKDDVNRVFFYARPVTPRRDFELGLLALRELDKRVDNLEVYFAGWDLSNYEIPFKHKSFGILGIEQLSEIYAQCDMCFVISNTNLSLLPLEVMASNSVAVCSVGDNSTWLVNEDNSILVDYDPVGMAEKMAYYFEHRDELDEIRAKGLAFAQSTSWVKEAEKVRDALLKGIAEDD